MRPYRAAAGLGFLILASTACLAQSAPPAAPARRPQPSAAVPAPATNAGPVDLEATRKRFDTNSAKTAASDRKRDAKLKQSMGSICAGCEATPPAKRGRAARPAATAPEDEPSPAD
ncbi:hypothetical protein MKK69_01105 [Methylobacterium sp. J-026]|uniref:hypothetical protein n=1 Tax=Methylobacterium sp. J-026 TaxID=2836624 RepID=UPI001FB9780F|nr:hypothetical protein [Methylobacterium sp. J-026]MCJ2132678.1 hypothetical protein [Methylobacterium sp. J-026]